MKIIPAVLTEDPAELEAMLRHMEGATDWVQIDIMDGRFVPSRSITADHLARVSTPLNLEVHLMVAEPEVQAEAFSRAGAKRIIFHYEATPNPEALVEQLRRRGVGVGLALNPDTPLAATRHLWPSLDLLLLLSVYPGFYGKEFLPWVLDRAREFKALGQPLPLAMDGGIKEDNLLAIKDAGVDIAYVGSAIFRSPDPKQAYLSLQALAEGCGSLSTSHPLPPLTLEGERGAVVRRGFAPLRRPWKSSKEMIIDFHTHISPPRIKENREQYLRKDTCFSLLYSQPRSAMATAEELVEAMERCGVDVSVILNITWSKEELCRESNDYIMESAARYPGKLVGFAALPPRPEAALRELERCVKGGMKGVGEVRGDMPGFDLLDSPLWEAVMPELARQELILLLHTSEPVGHLYPGKGKLTPEVVYPFLVRYPQVDVVCAHWGGGLPFYTLMPEVAQALGGVYVDTAASPFLYQPDIYRYLPPIVGVNKVLFGSDFPLIGQDRALSQLQGLRPKDRERISGENARRLLFARKQ